MKFKNIISVFTSLVITISCCMTPQTTIAENKYEDIEIKSVLSKEELPEAIDYDIAETKNHYKRLLEEEKNLNTIVFENTDGTNSLYLFSYPVKYKDSDGNICDKSLKIVESDNHDSFVTYSSNITTDFNFDLNDGVNLSFNNNELSLVPMFIEQSSTMAELSDDSKKVYYNCGNDVLIEYSLTYQGYKENIIINKYTGINQYEFKLKTNGMHLGSDESGHISAYNSKGISMANIGDIIVTDSKNNIIPGSIDYHEVVEDQEYIISISVDKEFLESSDTMYPVCIDPTIEVDYTHYGEYGYDGEAGIVHTTIFSNDTSSSNQTISIGKVNDSKIARTVMRFPGLIESNSWNYGFLTMNRSRINSAKVYIKDVGYSSASRVMEVDCHQYMKDWSSTTNFSWSEYANEYNSNILDYNNVSYTNGLIQSPLHTYSFDITQLVRSWDESGNNSWKKGIMFKASSNVEDGLQLYSFFGSYNSIDYAPYLIIDYDTPYNYTYANASSITYTYFTTKVLQSGQRYIFQTEKATNYDECDTELYLFKANMVATDTATWYNDDISQSNRYSKIDVVIPSTGQYVLMAKVYSGLYTSGALPTGHCNVCSIDPNTNVKSYLSTDALLGGYLLSMPTNQVYIGSYNSFTANLSDNYDTVMYVLYRNGNTDRKVIGFNDNYENNTNPGDHYWGNCSRISQDYNPATIQPRCVIVSSKCSEAIGNAEIYAMCKEKYTDINFFPNFKEDDSIISDSEVTSYNCISYSGGISAGWITPTFTRYNTTSGRLTPWYNSNMETAYDNFYGNNPPRYNGATTYVNTLNSNEAVINVYKNGSEYTHAAVKKPGNNQPHGYAWESKCGKEPRVFHELNSLNNDAVGKYGHPTRYYKISGTYSSAIPESENGISFEESVNSGYTIIMDVQANENEISFLKEIVNEIEQDKIDNYDNLYSSWINAINNNEQLRFTNDYYYYTKIAEYDELRNYIDTNPELLFSIIRDYLEGVNNVYITTLFDYIIVERNDFTKQLADNIRNDNNNACIASINKKQYIAPTLETNIRTFIVSLLNEEAYNEMFC